MLRAQAAIYYLTSVHPIRSNYCKIWSNMTILIHTWHTLVSTGDRGCSIWLSNVTKFPNETCIWFRRHIVHLILQKLLGKLQNYARSVIICCLAYFTGNFISSTQHECLDIIWHEMEYSMLCLFKFVTSQSQAPSEAKHSIACLETLSFFSKPCQNQYTSIPSLRDWFVSVTDQDYADRRTVAERHFFDIRIFLSHCGELCIIPARLYKCHIKMLRLFQLHYLHANLCYGLEFRTGCMSELSKGEW